MNYQCVASLLHQHFTLLAVLLEWWESVSMFHFQCFHSFCISTYASVIGGKRKSFIPTVALSSRIGNTYFNHYLVWHICLLSYIFGFTETGLVQHSVLKRYLNACDYVICILCV